MDKKIHTHSLDEIKNLVINWNRPNDKDEVEKFFGDLQSNFALYSPSLGLVVEYNDWYCGNEPDSQSIDFVPLSPSDLTRYWDATGFDAFDDSDYDAHWASGLLADFEHMSYFFDYYDMDDANNDFYSAINAISMVCLAPDWTSEPYMVI